MYQKIKSKMKKIAVVFMCIILLQNYGFMLANIAIAIENKMFNFTSSGNSDFQEIVKDNEENPEGEGSDTSKEQENENADTTSSETENTETEVPEEESEEEITEPEEVETPENTVGDTSEEVVEEEPEQEVEQQPIQIPEQVISSKISSENSSIYKGYFYANIVSSQKYETNYNYTTSIEIQDFNFAKEIYLEEQGDKFVFDTGTELVIGENTYYRQTRIAEAELNNILGEEGVVELLTKDGEIIGTINRQTRIIDGFYVYDYEVDVSEIIVKIVNPIGNGTLNIKQIKSIKSELEYSRKQIELFRYIKTIIKAKAIYNEEHSWELEQIENLINLEETESRVDLELNTTDFSTMLENQVTFNVTLKTNEERYDLFQDPTIEILMPSAIENVEITSINLLYKNGLSLSSWKVEENEAGKKVIKVALSGSQTEYTPGSMQEGTTLVIYTKINVDKLTSNTAEKIKMTYTNKNSSKLYYAVNGKESEEVDIRFVSKEGILKSNSILNYNANLDGIYGFNEEVLIGSLDVGGARKTASVNMAIVNNYEKELTNVSILGRIPSKGLVDGNGNNLETTIDTLLLNPIAYSGITAKIYYSYEIDANVEDDSWMEIVTDYSLVKSYKIILENSMKQGDRAEFSYNISIPENLNYNEKMFNTYQVNYYIDNQLITEVSNIGAATETREIVLEDCQEQIEQEVVTEDKKTESLTIGTTVTKGGIEVEEGEEIFERQILRYTVVLKNTTKDSLKNVSLKGKANNANLYYLKVVEADNYGELFKCKVATEDDGTKGFEEIILEELKPNETLKLEYEVIVNEVDETAEEYVFGEVYLKADGIEETKIETFKNKIKQAKIELKLEYGATETLNDIDLYSNASCRYCVKIKNISNEILENIDLNVLIPEILDYNPDTYLFGNNGLNRYVTKTISGNQITFEIPNLQIGEEKELYIVMQAKKMDLNVMSKKVNLISTVELEEDIYMSNEKCKTIHQSQTDISYEFTSNLKDGTEVQDGDKIQYILKLKNIGSLTTNLEIWDDFPYGFKMDETRVVKGENKYELKDNIQYLKLEEEIAPQEEIEVIIEGIVDEENLKYNQEYIENAIRINGILIEPIETNVISFKVKNPNSEMEKDESDSLENLYTPEELEKFEEIKNTEEAEEETEEKVEEDKNEQEENKDNNIKNEGNTENNSNFESSNNNSEKPSNKVEQNNNSNINNNIIIENKGKYSISGKAWLDLNKNGKYDDSEEKLKNVNIRLYKSSNGTSVVYSSNNLVAKTVTDVEGNYKFENLEDGYYLVMAEYNSEKYNLSEYKAEYAGESSNSDFITKNTKIDGKNKTVAISDILQVNSSNIGSIDLGLTGKDECDIEIKKKVSSITLVDDTGKQTINYKDDEIVKLDIAAKKIGKTKATIIYEFEIKNNGDIDTYITNIVDYLPEGLEFDEKANTGWYLSEDNKISNLSLVNTRIESGKTKKLKLALTSDITDDALGSYVNEVEVLEITNDKKLKETNLENNKSKVELLITIKTGDVILYLSLIVMVLCLLVGILLVIKKKIIKPVYK